MPKVLVVEDDALLALPIEDCLQEAGYEVVTAFNGNRALACLEGMNFDALLTDIRLGSGPDGWAVGRRAREINKDIPVVYMSADSAAAWEVNGVPHSAMLRKPYRLDDLVTELAGRISDRR